MKKLQYFILILMSTTLSGCSWLSSFFIINDTSKNIIVTYELSPLKEKSQMVALGDTLLFNRLKSGQDYDEDILGEDIEQQYNTQNVNGNKKTTVTIFPQTSIGGGYRLTYFTYNENDDRHEIFDNVVSMQIIREDSNDTIVLRPEMLSDLSRPFGKHHIALIFD